MRAISLNTNNLLNKIPFIRPMGKRGWFLLVLLALLVLLVPAASALTKEEAESYWTDFTAGLSDVVSMIGITEEAGVSVLRLVLSLVVFIGITGLLKKAIILTRGLRVVIALFPAVSVFLFIPIFILAMVFSFISVAGPLLAAAVLLAPLFYLIWGVIPSSKVGYFFRTLILALVFALAFYVYINLAAVREYNLSLMVLIGLGAVFIWELVKFFNAVFGGESWKEVGGKAAEKAKGLFNKSKKAETFALDELIWLQRLQKAVIESVDEAALKKNVDKIISKEEREESEFTSRLDSALNEAINLQALAPAERGIIENYVEAIKEKNRELIALMAKGGRFDQQYNAAYGDFNTKKKELLAMINQAIAEDQAIITGLERLEAVSKGA